MPDFGGLITWLFWTSIAGLIAISAWLVVGAVWLVQNVRIEWAA